MADTNTSTSLTLGYGDRQNQRSVPSLVLGSGLPAHISIDRVPIDHQFDLPSDPLGGDERRADCCWNSNPVVPRLNGPLELPIYCLSQPVTRNVLIQPEMSDWFVECNEL